jgi:erythromycin esterase-like protein
MADTLDDLSSHLQRHGDRAKLVVWEHNSHIGDARQTEMGDRGELNLGQLARMRHPGATALVGFTTYRGTVTAASAWDSPAERKRVRPALPESYEALFHGVGEPRFRLRFAGGASAALRAPRLERAIGVIYRPESERQSHYFSAQIASQFDAVVHIDETRAVEPLERTAGWELGEPPETYPSAL